MDIKPKIFIGMPTPATVLSETCDTLHLIQTDLAQRGIEALVMRTEGVYVYKQRNWMVRKAKENGCTHLFFLDNDMVAPQHIVARFLAYDKDIISTNYVIKAKRGKCKFSCTNENFDTIDLLETDVGLKKVHIAPTGTMLIKMSVFDTVQKYFDENNLNYPFFFHTVINHATIKDEFGEDSHFTHFANKAGIDVWIDADVSKQIEHIGLRAFNWRDCYN